MGKSKLYDDEVYNFELKEIKSEDDVDYTKKPFDLINKKIGTLTILPYYPKKKPNNCSWWYYCQCDCGNKEWCSKLKLSYASRKGEVKCNLCLNKDFSEKRQNSPGDIVNQWEFISLDHVEKSKSDPKRNYYYWKVKCQCCGEEKVIKAKNASKEYCEKRKIEGREYVIKMKEKKELHPCPNNCKDLTGFKSGKLTVLGYSFYDKIWKLRYWLCQCECGNKVCVSEFSFTTKKVPTSSCGVCNISVGETRIMNALKIWGVRYVTQYENPLCRDTNLLKFDFQVFRPDGSFFLVEYNGEQHYHPVSFGEKKKSKEQKFIETQRRDKIKEEFCKFSGIKLVVIPYWDFGNIEKILAPLVGIKNFDEDEFKDKATRYNYLWKIYRRDTFKIRGE